MSKPTLYWTVVPQRYYSRSFHAMRVTTERAGKLYGSSRYWGVSFTGTHARAADAIGRFETQEAADRAAERATTAYKAASEAVDAANAAVSAAIIERDRLTKEAALDTDHATAGAA